MGRKSISGGVMPKGTGRIQLDFNIDRKRFRPTLPWVPTNRNLQRARARLVQIKMQIAAGTFSFAEEFPDYRYRKRLGIPLRTSSCSDVFDSFLRHGEARVARGDLAPITLTSYRRILDRIWRPRIGRITFLSVRHSTLANIADAQRWQKKSYNNAVSALRRAFEFGYRDHPEQRDPAALLKSTRIRRADRRPIDPFSIEEAEVLIAAIHRDWGPAQGNYDEFRFFTGLRPSEEIALLASDFDPKRRLLRVSKSRVEGVDRDITKTGDSRWIELCPRALAVVERQQDLRDQMKRAGLLSHDCLFFDPSGAPFLDSSDARKRWRRTLERLPIRYRKPYAARHSSVSWNLMIGRNPLWVAEQHGHSALTMLTFYAAWTDGTLRSGVTAIRRAMSASANRDPGDHSSFAVNQSRPARRVARHRHLRMTGSSIPGV
jgi:integrase